MKKNSSYLNKEKIFIENNSLYLNPEKHNKSISNIFLLSNNFFSEKNKEENNNIKNNNNKVKKLIKHKILSPRIIPDKKYTKNKNNLFLLSPRNKNNNKNKENSMVKIAKQILYDNKIREKNYLRIKTYKNKIQNENNKNENKNNITNNYDNDDDNIERYLFQKRKFYVNKRNKRLLDFSGNIKPGPNYIDEVEKKYIRPYIMKENKSFVDFVENKKNKILFYFIIK